MKRVLITGSNSYLGDAIKRYLDVNGGYDVDILDMLDEKWAETDFSCYDVVFNVCAIVHRPNEKDDLYCAVNRDLAFTIAEKAKREGVKLFIQTSTNGVFGIDLGIISADSKYKPRNAYEKSKLEADRLIWHLNDDAYSVCIIRPPMIYGKGCRGNYPKMEKFALKSPVFPSLKNRKDFIYVLNMADFVKFAIDNELCGTFYPRDREPASVSHIVKSIARLNGRKIRLWSIFNPFVKLFLKCNHTLKLVFGDNYCTINDGASWVAPISLDDALTEMYEA